MILKFEIFQLNLSIDLCSDLGGGNCKPVCFWEVACLSVRFGKPFFFFFPLLLLSLAEKFSLTYNDDGLEFSVGISNFMYFAFQSHHTLFFFFFWKHAHGTYECYKV